MSNDTDEKEKFHRKVAVARNLLPMSARPGFDKGIQMAQAHHESSFGGIALHLTAAPKPAPPPPPKPAAPVKVIKLTLTPPKPITIAPASKVIPLPIQVAPPAPNPPAPATHPTIHLTLPTPPAPPPKKVIALKLTPPPSVPAPKVVTLKLAPKPIPTVIPGLAPVGISSAVTGVAPLPAATVQATAAQLPPDQALGFQAANSLVQGQTNGPPPPDGMSDESAAAYTMTHGMQPGDSDVNEALASTLTQTPEAVEGVATAIQHIHESLWTRFLRWLHITS